MSDQPDDLPEQIGVLLSTLAGLLSLGFGILLLVGVLDGLFGGAGVRIFPTVLALVFLSIAVATLPSLRPSIHRFRSPGTFGRHRQVDRRIVDDPDHGQPCAVCGETVTQGVERRYRDDLFVAGIPVAADTIGYNSYCVECADETERDDDPTRERQPERNDEDGRARSRRQ